MGDNRHMYDEILNEALHAVIKDFDSGQVRLETEGDLRGFLFHRCAEILSSKRHPSPIPVHAEWPIGDVKADLAIGPVAQTVADLKFEPFTTNEGTVFVKGRTAHSVEHDIGKLKAYAKQGRTGHFIMIELEGETTEGPWYFPSRTPLLGIPKEEWQETRHFTWVHYVVSPQ